MDVKQRIEAWAEKEQKGDVLHSLICPRCGGKMREHKIDNALSRVCNAYICSQCGTDEAMQDFISGDAIPFEAWHIVKE